MALPSSSWGQRGLKKQGQARDIEMDEQTAMEAAKKAQQSESLARLLGGLGINVDAMDADVLSQNPNVMSEVMQRTRPPEPRSRKQRQTASKAVISHGIQTVTGETRPVFNQNDMQAAWSEGFRQPEEEPKVSKVIRQGARIQKPCWRSPVVTNEAQRSEALGGGFAPYTAPKPAAAVAKREHQAPERTSWLQLERR